MNEDRSSERMSKLAKENQIIMESIKRNMSQNIKRDNFLAIRGYS